MIDFSTKVLVADDSARMRKIHVAHLTAIGFTAIECADDGEQALRMLRRGGYGLIISDWHMEPMTGLELLIEVRKDSAIADIPFIMVTGESKGDHVIQALDAGVTNYLVKPFNQDGLRAKLDMIFGKM